MPKVNLASRGIPDSLLARGVLSGSPLQNPGFIRSARPSEQIGMLEQRMGNEMMDENEMQVLRMLLAMQNQPKAAPPRQSTQNTSSYNPFAILSELLGGE